MVNIRDIDIILNTKCYWEKLKDSTILVTGGTGRLGIYIVNALLECNKRFNLNITIIVLARSREKLESEYSSFLGLKGFATLVQDITEPIKYKGNIDYCIHTAGLASPYDFSFRPVETALGHIIGTKNVLELARQKNIKKLVYISTVEVYGECSQEFLKEGDMGVVDCNVPRACYPEAKRMCETLLASYQAEYGINYSIVRLSHTLGPGVPLTDGRAFAEFIDCVLNDKDIVLHSDGSTARTYTYVSDAIGAVFLVLLNGNEYIYNVANADNLISTKDLALLIASLSKSRKTKVLFDNEKSKYSYLPFRLSVLDSSLALALGWKPQIDIETIFKWTLEYEYMKRGITNG